jgi:hypothetical protein
MPDLPLDSPSDSFRPPDIPTEVGCLRCGRVYESYLMEWRVETCGDGSRHGSWCCPTPECSGVGFGFDILPTDPHYRDERGGWVSDDEGLDVDDLDIEDWLEEELGPPTSDGDGRQSAGDDGNGEGGIPL